MYRSESTTAPNADIDLPRYAITGVREPLSQFCERESLHVQISRQCPLRSKSASTSIEGQTVQIPGFESIIRLSSSYGYYL